MFERVLIAVDNSMLMPYLVRYTAALFPKAEYYLASTVETLSLHGRMPERAMHYFREMAADATNTASAILEGYGIKANRIVLHGHPVHEVLRYARDLDIRLIALDNITEPGELRPDRMCREILERMGCAALIINAPVEPKIPKKILNPTTDCIFSRSASRAAVELASLFGASLTALYIGRNGKICGRAIEFVRGIAEKKGIDFRGIGGGHIPFIEIMERSREHDMIIGSRGRVGAGYKLRFLSRKLALGKTELEVIASAKVPLIVFGD